jgi:hypothetical protein
MTAINSNRAIRGPVTAVPVVAGKGVRLVADTVNNRWVVEADETELFQASSLAPGDTKQTYNLSESATNFEMVRVFIHRPMSNTGTVGVATVELMVAQLGAGFGVPLAYSSTFDGNTYDGKYFCKILANNQWQDLKSMQGANSGYYAHIYKIIGINRVASA